jgi:hypothetical protein
MPGQKGSIDEKGVVQWMVPYFVEDLADVLIVGREAPVSGLIEVGRTWDDDGDVQGVGLKVEVTYEGGSGGGSQPDTYEFDSSFREETLVAHSEWKQFKEVFKGRYDEENKTIKFPEFLGEYKKGLGLPNGASNADGKLKNPLFGVETFLTLASIFRHTYVRDSVPSSIFESIGTIRSSLPGGFPTPTGRDWLIMPPKISQRGGVYQITEELMLSQPGGWPEAVYSLIT